MIKIIDTIGFAGPFILLAINSVYLWRRNKYLVTYLTFFCIDAVINNRLKHFIKQPRPDNQIYLNEYDITEENIDNHRYGMPSGHAQSVGYSITFLYLSSKSTALLITTSFLGAITVYQRYKYHRHTIKQLLVGLIIGIGLGFVALDFINRNN